MKRLNALASLVLASVLASPCSAEEKSGWEALGLESVKLDRATLYYEKCLEPKLGVFEARHKELVTEQAQQAKLTEELLEKFDEIVADVNQIVGASFKDDEKAKLEGALRSLLHQGMAFSRAIVKADACLAVRQTVKDYLRGGGSLPGFTYDKATDTAQYNWRQQFSLGKRTGVDKVLLPFPVSSPESMEEDLESRFSSYRKILPWLPGSFLHELVEMTIVVRLRPYNPYFRWFTDGFANAIASRLVRKHISEDAARLFASGHDVTEYSDLEKDINLYYWMGTDFCIETPLDSEERLKHARYAYATLEAERLIEKYGIECVAKIVDKACKDRVTNPRNLVAAVKEVTGEDIEKRFQRYQTFQTREEGVNKYAVRLRAAAQGKDYPEALSNLLRVWELGSGNLPQNYHAAAHLLFLMGHEEHADRAIQDGLDLFKGRRQQKDYSALQKLFIKYALGCRNPQKALGAAEEVLKEEPDFVPALAVHMLKLGALGKMSEAREVARRILELEKDTKSQACELAKALLAREERE